MAFTPVGESLIKLTLRIMMQNIETGTGPIMAGEYPTNGMLSGTETIRSMLKVTKEKVMELLSNIHTFTAEQLIPATSSPVWCSIVRKNYDRNPAAFKGVGPV